MSRWKLPNWGLLKFYNLISDVVNVVDDEWDGGIGSSRLYNWLSILNSFTLISRVSLRKLICLSIHCSMFTNTSNTVTNSQKETQPERACHDLLVFLSSLHFNWVIKVYIWYTTGLTGVKQFRIFVFTATRANRSSYLQIQLLKSIIW